MGWFTRAKNKVKRKTSSYYSKQVMRAVPVVEYWVLELERNDMTMKRANRIMNHIRRIRKVQLLCVEKAGR